MAEENKDQKTEEASPKRIRETEEKGQFAHSKEVSSAFVLLAGILSMYIAGQQSTHTLMKTWTFLFSQSHTVKFIPDELLYLFKTVMADVFLILAPILLTVMVAGVVSNLIQTQGLKFSLHPLIPKFSKLNPINGVSRIFSKNSFSELVKSLFKISAVGLIAFFTIKERFHEIPQMMDLGVGQILSFMGEVALEIMIKTLAFLIFLALLDYVFQKFVYKERIRMTKQEVKDERKETEGNPQIKQRIRSVQLEMARKRMMAAVPEADVIVTNPVRIAVAIKYDRDKHAAPLVVAKGMGEIARKIRELAQTHDVPLVEDKPLARVLYKAVDVGQLIPASLYRAVAEILAYVYKLKNRVTP